MTKVENISAVFFDMDGTLIDSEPYTERAIRIVCSMVDISEVNMDFSQFDGMSWINIGQSLIEHYPQLNSVENVSYELHLAFQSELNRDPPPPDGYLHAAKYFKLPASQCLVFEDSLPGLQSAKNAGMQVIAITQKNKDIFSAIADMTIENFATLPENFFNYVRKQ